MLGETRTDRGVRGRIGLAPQQDALFDRLSVLDFVTFAALTHGLTPAEADTRSRRTIAWVDLDPDDPKPVGSFSKGMRQRAKLAAAVVNDPAVLVLDEPLTGLDPVQRQRMIALFNELAAQGTCSSPAMCSTRSPDSDPTCSSSPRAGSQRPATITPCEIRWTTARIGFGSAPISPRRSLRP